MFQSDPLNDHLKTSHTIASAQEVFLELNLGLYGFMQSSNE